MPIFEAARRYREQAVPLVVVAGDRYGTGSSRDWSAKGPRELGVRAVIVISFERLHRANLVAAGVLPLQFAVANDASLLTGEETLTIDGLSALATPLAAVRCEVRRADGSTATLPLIAALHTRSEFEQFAAGGLYRLLFARLLREAGGGRGAGPC